MEFLLFNTSIFFMDTPGYNILSNTAKAYSLSGDIASYKTSPVWLAS